MARLAALLLLVGLVACGRGPAPDQVRQDLGDRLARAFDPGTFEIVAFSERGSSADTTGPSGEGRRVVYYDAQLRLTRDVDFGAWNVPGAASLVTVLGAGRKGIRGVKAGGNKTGDEIRGYGTAIYRAQDDSWQEVAPAGFTPPVEPALVTISPPPVSERLVAALHETVQGSPAATTPAGQAIIDHELSRSLVTIQSRLTRLARGYAIAAGPERGQYVRFVQALALTTPLGLTFQPLITTGSVENLNLLQQDQVLLGLAQADIAKQAVAGQGPFAPQGPFPELRALGSLYPELLHIIVRADLSAHTVRDLMHKRINLGPAGAGSRATAERLLRAYGMESGRDFAQDESSIASAMTALEAGAVDAVIQVIGIPADEIRNAAGVTALQLLPIDEAVLAKMTAEDAALLRGEIPKQTYSGITQDVATIAVAALLVTTSSLSEAEAATLVKAIFGNKADLLTAGSAQGGQLGIATAHRGIPIPLAAGAEEALSGLQAAQ